LKRPETDNVNTIFPFCYGFVHPRFKIVPH